VVVTDPRLTAYLKIMRERAHPFYAMQAYRFAALAGDTAVMEEAIEAGALSWQPEPVVRMRTEEPRALDLFCGAGGAARGLQEAGYHVTGVDVKAQPRYCGDRFIQADAMAIDWTGYDLIWASPPCQAYSDMSVVTGKTYPDLIGVVRERLVAAGAPYIIENVEGAPLRNPLMLCGTMFGLLITRHRLFETNPPIYFPPATCAHQRPVVKHGRRPDRDRHYAAATGHFSDVGFVKQAMGIDWMTRDELSQAIPPAYSRFLAMQLSL
jgi:DNA (cytosine-5)-methyltransferase 1